MICVWGAVGARKPSPRSSTQDFIRNRLVVIPLLRGPELAIADSTAPLTLTRGWELRISTHVLQDLRFRGSIQCTNSPLQALKQCLAVPHWPRLETEVICNGIWLPRS